MKKFNETIHPKFILLASIIFFSFCAFVNYGIAQTVLYSTDFGTTTNVNPTGWTFTGVNMNISTNTTSSGYNGASGNAYLGEGNSVSFTNTSGTVESTPQLSTSTATLLVNTTGYTTITVSFGMRKSSASYNTNVSYTFEWSTDGTNFTPIAFTESTAGAWGLATGTGLTLPAATDNQANLFLRWTFIRTGSSSNFKIDDFSVIGQNSSTNTPPTIVMDMAATTNYLDGGLTSALASPDTISGVINDPTDPASTLGINFTINDAQTAASNLTLTATSSNLTVVPISNLIFSGSGASRTIKITPTAVGYSTITINVSDGTFTTPYVMYYAASAASATPSATIWQTGMSDASDGIALDSNYYISADDELDVINVYDRYNSGLPLVSFDYTNLVGLTDPSKPETDIEGSVTSPNNTSKKYFIGSMSTGGSSFSIRPNRDILFATLVTGTGAATAFTVNGRVTLRSQIVSWGDLHGYDFSASAAAGIDSKSVSGFAIEAMAFGPDGTTLYIGLRAPLVPTNTRTNAVIIPIQNFETWFNNGLPSGNPTIGAPIELNLGGRGFRDLIRLANGTYIIIAGNPAGSPTTSAIYKWTGNAFDAPIPVTTSADGILNLEGVLPVTIGTHISTSQLQVISDGGSDAVYGDGVASKDFTMLGLRKFRLDNLSNLDLCLITSVSIPIITQSGLLLTSTAGASYQWYFNNTPISGATSQSYSASQNGDYSVTVADSSGCSASSAAVNIATTEIVNYVSDKNEIRVYPNPYSESTSLQLTLSKSSHVTIELYSLLGQKIQEITSSNYGEGSYIFTIGLKKLGYSAGTYLIKTIVRDKITMTRIIENN
jgi:hypothetical protein